MIKEVKRHAEVGEYIKIVNAGCWLDKYKNGDILKVEEIAVSNTGSVFCVGIDTFVEQKEYVVLENYVPDSSTQEHSKKSKIYISGKISNNPNYLEDFEKCSKKLLNKFKNCDIINPALILSNMPSSTTYDEYMRLCYAMLDMCNSICMLENWEDSKGACIEYGYSLAMDKIILFEKDLEE